jgi:hypothetical protein
MKKRIVYLAIVLLWLVSGIVLPASTETATALTEAKSFTPGEEPLTSEFFTVDSDVDDLTGATCLQVQDSAISPSADRDYDGLTDDVETSGWQNAVGSFVTDPFDRDSDNDGLTDGQEKLYETDPLNEHSPGIYVEYEDHFKTRQYYATEPRAHRQMVYPYPWGWQQYGDHLISFTAVVMRRGSSFSVGGPVDATIQINKSLSSLTTLPPVQDPCTGQWRISVPSGGTLGKYEITLQDQGGWSKSLKLYVIFEMHTPSGDLTQKMIDVFLYDDDRANIKDEKAIVMGDGYYDNDDYSWIPSGSFINEGFGYRFSLQQFEPWVFETHVIEAINGLSDRRDVAEALLNHTDKVTRFNNPRVTTDAWRTLHPGTDDSNQCSNISGLLTAFVRAAGIPARPFFIDRYSTSFDHAVEIWLNNTWEAARGYSGRESACVYDNDGDIVWDCVDNVRDLRSRSRWGRSVYEPWYPAYWGNGSLILAADEDWGGGLDYRWASWDWDGILRDSHFDTLVEPYWSSRGLTQEPTILGSPSNWPTVRDFSIDASPNSRTVAPGESVVFTVYANTNTSFSNPVQFVDGGGIPRVTGLPANTTVGFSSETCTPNCNSTLSIQMTSTTPAGTYDVTITGRGHTSPRSSGGWYRDTTVTLVVTPPPDFTIDASPASSSVVQGDSTNFTVDLGSLYGFSDAVALSVTGVPMSTTVGFVPGASCTPNPNCSRVLSVDTAADAPVGTHTLTIRGQSGGLQHQTAVDLIINASAGVASTQADTGFSSPVQVAGREALDNDAVSVPAALPVVSLDKTFGDGWLLGDGQADLAVRGVDDYGIDLDQDGYFDQLVVEIEVQATQPGTYWLQGQLGVDNHVQTLSKAGGLIDSSVVRADMTTGIVKVQFVFDGLRISAAKVDGPYVLKYLSITNVDDPGPDEFVNDSLGLWVSPYTTSVYRADEFQNQGARLAEHFTEQGIDAMTGKGNSLLEQRGAGLVLWLYFNLTTWQAQLGPIHCRMFRCSTPMARTLIRCIKPTRWDRRSGQRARRTLLSDPTRDQKSHWSSCPAPSLTMVWIWTVMGSMTSWSSRCRSRWKKRISTGWRAGWKEWMAR